MWVRVPPAPPQRANKMNFTKVEDDLPPEGEIVLARGWRAGGKYYLYDLALRMDNEWYVVECRDELWFTPHEWIKLPQPNNT